MQILIAFKQAELAQYKAALNAEKGTHLTEVHTLEDAVEYALTYSYDSLLLDYDLFTAPLGAFLDTIRKNDSSAPIICMGGKRDIPPEDVIQMLDMGCDEVIYTHIPKGELLARLRALVRRTHGFSHSTIMVGNVEVDLNSHQVMVNAQQVDLTNKEQAIIECLALNKDRVLSKEALLSHVYGGMDEPEIRIIDAFIWRIRKKLNDAGQENDYMQTVWGRGYRLSDHEGVEA